MGRKKHASKKRDVKKSSARPAGFSNKDARKRMDARFPSKGSIGYGLADSSSGSESVSYSVSYSKSGSSSSNSSSSNSSSSSSHDKHKKKHHRKHDALVKVSVVRARGQNDAASVPTNSAEAAPERGMNVASEKRQVSVADETRMTLFISDTPRNLAKNSKMKDAHGNRLISLADGIMVESASPAIEKRIAANRTVASNEQVARNPSKFAKAPRDIIQMVEIESAKSTFPFPIVASIDSMEVPSEKMRVMTSKSKSRNAVSFTVYPDNKIKNRKLFQMSTSKGDAGFFNSFPDFNTDNIREDVVTTPAKIDGHKMVAIPHTSDRAHPVVHLAREKLAELMTDEEKAENARLAKEHNDPTYLTDVPSRILYQSRDSPDHVLMSSEVFNELATRCEVGIKQKYPLSNMDHPHGVIGRLHSSQHFSAGNTSLIGNQTDSHLESDWTELADTHGLREEDLDKPCTFVAHLRVKSIETSKVSALD